MSNLSLSWCNPIVFVLLGGIREKSLFSLFLATFNRDETCCMFTLHLPYLQSMFSKPLICFGFLSWKPSLVGLHLYCCWINNKASNCWFLVLQSPGWTQGLQCWLEEKKYFINLSLWTFSMMGTCFITWWYEICVHLVSHYWKLFLKNKQTNNKQIKTNPNKQKTSPKSSTETVVLYPVLIDQINPTECEFLQLSLLKSICFSRLFLQCIKIESCISVCLCLLPVYYCLLSY